MPEMFASSPIDVLPVRVSYRTDEDVVVEMRGLTGAGVVTVWRLGDLVARVDVDGAGLVALGSLPEGGYGVELDAPAGSSRTAVQVIDDPRSRLRYGFVADYVPDREVAAVVDNVRRLHLNGIQFYDWAYRHADVLGGGESYTDPLGQVISLETVRRLVNTVQQAGAAALGYAAVYAVGPDEWPEWENHALLTPNGEPYGLGDFLFLVDPIAEPWSKHLTTDLQAATASVGFDGFHLDQYGYPKRATRPDGSAVDVAESFAGLLDDVRAGLPSSRLVFNNVNDFPTWRMASGPQDAVYIEPWPPHVTLGALAALATSARASGGDKPVVIAAYQHVYDEAPTEAADTATALTMATLFSHGATQLLAGEADRILVDPYYVRNHRVDPSTAALLERWYDFLVEHDELLMDPSIVDVTGSYVGDYNDDCDVDFPGAPTANEAVAGSVWRRVTGAGDRLVVHLINLTGQPDTLWDSPRAAVGDPGAGELRVRRVGEAVPRVRVADPDRSARLVDVPVVADGDHAVATLPQPYVWQLAVIDP